MIVSSLNSLIYFNCQIFWALCFSVGWKRQVQKTSVRWNVQNCEANERIRPDFQYSRVKYDRQTGLRSPDYPQIRRWGWMLFLTIPTIIALASLLAVVICVLQMSEIIFSQFYHGYAKSIVMHVPTVLYILSIPTISAIYRSVALKLNKLENWETIKESQANLTLKHFVVNFLVQFLELIMYAIVLVPMKEEFASFVTHYTDWKVDADKIKMSASSLQEKYIYYMVTAQVINFFQEMVLPIVANWGTRKYQESKIKSAQTEEEIHKHNLNESEHAFLKRVRHEITLPVYDIFTDYCEMATQVCLSIWRDVSLQRSLASCCSFRAHGR